MQQSAYGRDGVSVAWVSLGDGREQSACGHCRGAGCVPGGRDGYRSCRRCGGSGDPPLGTPPFRVVQVVRR